MGSQDAQTVVPFYLLMIRGFVGSLLMVVLVYMLYHVAQRGLGILQQRGRLTPALAFPLRRTLGWAAVVVAVLLVLQQWGILADAWTMLTALLAMIAIGFVAVWSILSNTFCALVLMIARPFEIGDTIELVPDALRGKVIDFNMLFTTLRSEEGELIQIPNNMFFQRSIRRRTGTATSHLDQQLQKPQPTE